MWHLLSFHPNHAKWSTSRLSFPNHRATTHVASKRLSFMSIMWEVWWQKYQPNWIHMSTSAMEISQSLPAESLTKRPRPRSKVTSSCSTFSIASRPITIVCSTRTHSEIARLWSIRYAATVCRTIEAIRLQIWSTVQATVQAIVRLRALKVLKFSKERQDTQLRILMQVWTCVTLCQYTTISTCLRRRNTADQSHMPLEIPMYSTKEEDRSYRQGQTTNQLISTLIAVLTCVTHYRQII